MNIRSIDIFSLPQPRGYRNTRYCAAPGCGVLTREGKEYCTDHVDHHPYAQKVLKVLEQKEDDDNRVERRGARAAKLTMLSSKEVVSHLQFHGPRTTARLARELNLPTKLVEAHVNKLKQSKIVTTKPNKRGDTVVKLNE